MYSAECKVNKHLILGMGGIFFIYHCHDCAAIANRCHIVCKKKTDEDVGIDVEVEDRDLLASSAENGEVRSKKGLHLFP